MPEQEGWDRLRAIRESDYQAAQRALDDLTGDEPDEYVEPCEPEFIDGSYFGCGACAPCRDQAEEEAQARAEMDSF